jgi:DNA (cytosine-5)-methyltransferase 1
MEEKVRRYSIGSLFAGIGGFELGLERAIPGAYTLWQVEQNTFCQKVLAKHWTEARIYDDVKNINKKNVERVDILCGGFPCQDISTAGKGEGLNGKKSGLWWEMHRIIEELQPRAVIMENVAAINVRGLGAVLGSLSQIGYDAEWCTISSGGAFGLPHKRDRWFAIAYPSSIRLQRSRRYNSSKYQKKNTDWKTNQFISSVQREALPFMCRAHNGIPSELGENMMRALGNAIVPQCSEWIGKKLWESGILQAGEYHG